MCDKWHLHWCVAEQHLWITRRRSTQQDACRPIRVLTARYYQQWWTIYSSRIAIFIHHLHWMPPLILMFFSRHTISDGNAALGNGATVLHIVLTAHSRLCRICVLLTHLFLCLLVVSWKTAKPSSCTFQNRRANVLWSYY